jgi:hypothetical protein
MYICYIVNHVRFNTLPLNQDEIAMRLYIYTYINTECDANPVSIFGDETCYVGNDVSEEPVDPMLMEWIEQGTGSTLPHKDNRGAT